MRILFHMFIKCVRIFHVIFSLIIRLLFSCHRESVIIKRQSKCNSSIVVSKYGSKRIMRFNNLLSGAQSEIDLNRIDYPCVEYIQLMIISLVSYPLLLFDRHILIIGLGGGILPRAIRKLYPMALITIIEIDPVVIQIAKEYFYFKEDSRMKVYIIDGRTFIQNCPLSTFYDIIYLDAYDAISGMPFHMKTQEFFCELKSRLNPNGGLVIINLVCIYQSYLNVRRTIDSVFGEENLITYRSSDFVNIIAVASLSISNLTTINHKSNIENEIKDKLNIDVSSLIERKQKQIFNQNLSVTIYTDDFNQIENQEEMSLTQFVQIV